MNVAAVITACAVLFTALVAGVVSIIREIRGVHAIVNQQRTDMLEEIRELKQSLRARGGHPED